MSNLKFSQLAQASTMIGTDLVPIVRMNTTPPTNRVISLANLLSHLNSNIEFNTGNSNEFRLKLNNNVGLFLDYYQSKIGINTDAPSSTFHLINGNIQTGTVTGTPGLFIHSKEQLSVPTSGTIQDLTTNVEVCELTLASDSVTTYTYELLSGTSGQLKTIYIKAESVSGAFAISIKPKSGIEFINVDSTGVVLNKLGSSVTLMAISSTKWVVLSSNWASITAIA